MDILFFATVLRSRCGACQLDGVSQRHRGTDAKHINRWINRLLAAYQRAGVVPAKDKFAFLESTFDVAANPKINQFLYGTNTDADWDLFLAYLKEEYGKTQWQRAALLITEYPRQGLRPTQYMAQMKGGISSWAGSEN